MKRSLPAVTLERSEGSQITTERLYHILEHPEMQNMESAIEETIENPQCVIRSVSDKNAHLYYNYYYGTWVGNKWLCVVVKYHDEDAFVLTAYLTDKIKQGEQLWQRK